jgi:pimeloyl-ACP methyl ester carboxylesterase
MTIATKQRSSAMTAPTRFIEANGISFAYRRLGQETGIPLVLLQHITGTMDHWDPVVVDGLAEQHPVIIFDNTGVSRSSGSTPATVEEMANHAVGFIGALGLTQIDLLGFSLGGFVAQLITADNSGLVRRLILAGTGPEGGTGIKNLPQVLTEGRKQSPREPRLYLFFDQTDTSQAAGRAFIERQARRTEDRDPDSSNQTVMAQAQAIVRWGSREDAEYSRLNRIRQPVLVVNGKNDLMIPTINSYALFEHLPDAKLVLYPDSGHGGLFQFGDSFVQECLQFLAAPSRQS